MQSLTLTSSTKFDQSRIDEFENYLLRQNRSLNTVRVYVSRVNQYNRSPYVTMIDWLNSLDSSQPATIRLSIAALKSFCKCINFSDLAEELSKYKPPAAKPPHPRPIPGGIDTVNKFINSSNTNIKARLLIALGSMAGLRVSESIAVCKDDITNNTLLVHGKGMRYREVPVSKKLAYILEDCDAPRYGSYVNASNSNARMIIQKQFIKWEILHEDGTFISSHDLRATFATEVYERTGHDIVTVQKLLGHANVAQTQNYLGVTTKTLRAAVEF